MNKVYNDFAFELTMGAHIPESNSSGNLTRVVSEAGIFLPGYLAVILSVLMVTLVVVVVAGNALVIVAFIVDKTLRNQSNYFFLNLAISDFLVGELLPFLHHLSNLPLLFLPMNETPLNAICTRLKFHYNYSELLLVICDFMMISSFLFHSFITFSWGIVYI